jgi:hypothetical protein
VINRLRFLGVLRRVALVAALRITAIQQELRDAVRMPHRIGNRGCGSSRYPQQREALQFKSIGNRFEIVKTKSSGLGFISRCNSMSAARS